MREVWFLLAGLVGAVFFFTLYPSQHPVSTVDLSTDRKNVELRAVDHLSRLGYFLDDFQTQVRLRTPGESQDGSTNHLLDSLQSYMGRPAAIEMLKNGDRGVLKPWYWEVTFNDPFGEGGSGPGSSAGSELDLVVHYDMEGNFTELVNSTGRLPDQRINRQLLDAVLMGESDSAEAVPYRTMSDSLLPRHLYFDLEQPDDTSREVRREELLTSFGSGLPFRLNRSEAEAIARYYIGRSGWSAGEFRRDTVYIERVQNFNTAQVAFVTPGPVHGQRVRLEVQVTPVGSLLGMRVFYNPGSDGENNMQNLMGLLRTLLILGFLIACVIISFYRIRARAVDTRSALVASILGGLMVALYILLANSSELDFFGGSGGFYSSLFLLVGVGISGGASCLLFFILFATGDSITRQYWPRKLATYDYFRQGMVFNKPVGTVLLRSATLSLVLAGLWSVLLWIFPDFYLHIPASDVFVDGSAGWPPVYLLLYNAWYSFGLVLIVFLIIGSQVYARSRNRLWVAVTVMLASALFFPVNLEIGPAGLELAVGAIMGLALFGIFDRWDFSTLLLSLFLMLGWLHSAPGWLTPGSPDLYIFICYLIFMLVLVAGGTLAILMGKEEKVLPRYVPEYVEELAQEERIKQELQIARQVQQSFLPTQIPDIGKLEMSALCQPAYETGGDYYDFVRLDDHRVGVAIGDVSGKGIQAAFYMTFIKGILHSLCHETDSPAELLKKTNRLFFDNAQKGTFISLVYGILDTKQQTFTFSRAGHNPVLHMGRTGTVRELQPGGLGIGLTREHSFDDNIREIRLDLDEGDILMLYTDGIVEALNEKRQFYGTSRLHELLKRLKGEPSGQIVAGLFEDVGRFMGNAAQHDDMTILLIRYGG